MTTQTLLIELLTEELPPKALERLSTTFANEVFTALRKQKLAGEDSVCTPYATPRRLALTVSHVVEQQADSVFKRKGPSVAAGLDADGNPSKALQGFMRGAGVIFEQLQRNGEGKGECFVACIEQKGKALEDYLSDIVALALKKLPIPKLMRWGDSDHQFVRPVHALTMLHGSSIIPGEILGLQSGNVTRGHRFLCAENITIKNADDYEETLEQSGNVIPCFSKRRDMIAVQLDEQAENLGATWIGHTNLSMQELMGLSNEERSVMSALLDEVSALVEYPAVYVGEFEEEYLEVPQECLILTMQQNQKYFPLLDTRGKLLNKFLMVSNMPVSDPSHIICGNQRVVRPRLADARFFFNHDSKKTLESRVPGLDNVVYHNKLGSQAKRGERVRIIAREIAEMWAEHAHPGQDHAQYVALADRAALLAKCDLLTGMVGEFPELQGTMGRYYALNDKEDILIASAIEEHYQPRFAGDALPGSEVATIVALADKLETLLGMFGIGQIPTGDKDPFALRRHALGIIRMLVEGDLPLNFSGVLEAAWNALAPSVYAESLNSKKLQAVEFYSREATLERVSNFVTDRLAGNLREQGYHAQEVDAVLALRPQRLGEIPKRLAAVRAFAALPEAVALAAANKRVGNILKKVTGEVSGLINLELLKEPAEQALHQAVSAIAPKADAAFAAGDYAESLQVLAALRMPVDAFFDNVMVNAEDATLRTNRLALLAQLHHAMNRVADISRLAV